MRATRAALSCVVGHGSAVYFLANRLGFAKNAFVDRGREKKMGRVEHILSAQPADLSQLRSVHYINGAQHRYDLRSSGVP
ncbi:hypothetical protein ALC57_09974 [Trachymyrmex cornetzi]|uniref:Uncharacterized protein n=1 Tax=Trachymyrmex cornetzi TaxID=471704 RepID=A0A195DXH7_9HYME|nr:hypothetical protein ALC57_09974 [Trachymyrmex cornetzi]